MSLYPISFAIGQESQESNDVPLEKAPICDAETYAAGDYSIVGDDGAVARTPLYASLFPAATAWNKAVAFFGGVAAAWAAQSGSLLAIVPALWLSKPETLLRRIETLMQEKNFEALNRLVEQIDGYETEMQAEGQGQAARAWRATINALVIRYEELWRHSLSELPQGLRRFVFRAFVQQSLGQTPAISEQRLDMALRLNSQADLSALGDAAELARALAEHAVHSQDCRVIRQVIAQLDVLADTARQENAHGILAGLEWQIQRLWEEYEAWQKVNLEKAGRILSLANTVPLTLDKRYADAVLATEMADEPRGVEWMRSRYQAILRIQQEFAAAESAPERVTSAEPVYIGETATALMQPSRLGSLFETLKRDSHRHPAAETMYLELARLLGTYPDLFAASLDYQIRICVDEEAQGVFRDRMGREEWTPAQTAYALAEAYTRGRRPTLSFGNGNGSDLRQAVLERMDALERPERDPRAEEGRRTDRDRAGGREILGPKGPAR